MNDSTPQGGGQNRMGKNLLIGILVLIVLFLLFSWKNADDTVTQESGDDTAQNGVDDEILQPALTNFEGIMPDNWELLSRARSAVNTLTSGQEINFYILQDPTDENIVYFSTSSFDYGDGMMQIGVYRYRTDNYNFERLFRRSYDVGDIDSLPANEFPVFHVVGYDDGNLILLVQGESDSPGICAQPLLLAADTEMGRKLWSMSIDDPYSGFEDYTLPTDIHEKAQQLQDDCLKEIE